MKLPNENTNSNTSPVLFMFMPLTEVDEKDYGKALAILAEKLPGKYSREAVELAKERVTHSRIRSNNAKIVGLAVFSDKEAALFFMEAISGFDADIPMLCAVYTDDPECSVSELGEVKGQPLLQALLPMIRSHCQARSV